jgi:leader peptidase (prepilin peptidase)/N-methyltransferase
MTALESATLLGACLVAALAGLAAGAIVNAIADRVVGVDAPTWSAIQCQKCGAPLPSAPFVAIAELVKPRVCQQCGHRASPRRPLTQLALAIAFPLLLLHALINPGVPGIPVTHRVAALPTWALITLGALLFTALAFTFVVDLEHRLIYDLAIFPPIVLIIGAAAVFNRDVLPALILAGVLAGGLFLLLYGAGWLIYRQEALGFGDVKLAALMGVAAGWPSITTALAITVACGFLVALLLLASGAASRRAYIPFGVFMALATVITLLTNPFPW